jgi:hypothetical protein
MSLYQICQPKQDLADNKNGKIIAKGSEVVILDLLPNNKAVVCRKGFYMDSVVIDLNLLSLGR